MIRINLLPSRDKELRDMAIRQLATILALVVLVLIVLMTVRYTAQQEYLAAANEAEILQKDVKKEQAELRRLDRHRKEEEELQRRLSLISRLEKGRRGPVRLLDDLARAKPKRVWLTQLSEDGQKITLLTRSLGQTDTSEYMKKLQRSAILKNVNLGATQRVEESGLSVYNTDITAVLDYSGL